MKLTIDELIEFVIAPNQACTHSQDQYRRDIDYFTIDSVWLDGQNHLIYNHVTNGFYVTRGVMTHENLLDRDTLMKSLASPTSSILQFHRGGDTTFTPLVEKVATHVDDGWVLEAEWVKHYHINKARLAEQQSEQLYKPNVVTVGDVVRGGRQGDYEYT